MKNQIKEQSLKKLRLIYRSNAYCIYLLFLIIGSLFYTQKSYPQVIPSSSTNSIINIQSNNNGTTSRIKGGIKSGKNLFHRFNQFDTNNNNKVVFENPASISNIIANIQSGKISKINSIIGVDGTANLFLLNKNGFIFGPNSALQVQGSFIVSTASSLNFSDGFTLITDNKNQKILTIGQPDGLSVTQDSGSIAIFGSGHQLSFKPIEGINFPVAVTGAGESLDGLRLQPNNSIGIISNGITLNGGIVTAPSGEIFISSLNNGEVELESYSNKLFFNNKKLNNLSNINLTNKALIDSSGLSESKINLSGQNININENSFILNQAVNSRIPSEIRIYAGKNLELSGENRSKFNSNSTFSSFQSSIFTQNIFGPGTNIKIDAENILLKDGGTIEAISLISGTTGDILINASKSLSIIGFSDLDPIQSTSSISTISFNNSVGGDIVVNAKNISIRDTGALGSNNIGSMQGGDVIVNASNNIYIGGFNPINLGPSLISSLTIGDGRSGDIRIQTKSLVLQNTGAITNNTYSSGTSGDIQIKSYDLTIDGTIEGTGPANIPFTPTGISASGDILNPALQSLFLIPTAPSGDAGSIKIESHNIEIINNGIVAVANLGSGNAGNLNIYSNNFKLSNNSRIAGLTNGGNGGNINIFAKRSVISNSQISASALLDGLGGNINIETDLFVSFGANIISANAINNKGGNIRINTQGFFPSPGTKITATSEAGAKENGTVTLNALKIGAEETITRAPNLETSPQLISACNPSTGDSKFVAMGPGALRIESSHFAETDSILDSPTSQIASTSQTAPTPTENPIVEATGWTKEHGKTVLIAKTKTQSAHASSDPSLCKKS